MGGPLNGLVGERSFSETKTGSTFWTVLSLAADAKPHIGAMEHLSQDLSPILDCQSLENCPWRGYPHLLSAPLRDIVSKHIAINITFFDFAIYTCTYIYTCKR